MGWIGDLQRSLPSTTVVIAVMLWAALPGKLRTNFNRIILCPDLPIPFGDTQNSLIKQPKVLLPT